MCQNVRYDAFINTTVGKKVVFLELRIGYNTLGMIRFPFEQEFSKMRNFIYGSTHYFRLDLGGVSLRDCLVLDRS